MDERLRLHIFNAENMCNRFKNLEINIYIRDLLSKNLYPKIEIVDDKNLNSETFYIKEYLKKYKLCNRYIGVNFGQKKYSNFINFTNLSELMIDKARPQYISNFINDGFDSLSLNQKIEIKNIIKEKLEEIIIKFDSSINCYKDIKCN